MEPPPSASVLLLQEEFYATDDPKDRIDLFLNYFNNRKIELVARNIDVHGRFCSTRELHIAVRNRYKILEWVGDRDIIIRVMYDFARAIEERCRRWRKSQGFEIYF